MIGQGTSNSWSVSAFKNTSKGIGVLLEWGLFAKVKLLENLLSFQIRGSHLFSQRAEWAFDRFETDEFRYCVEKGFDKCIAVCYIATNVITRTIFPMEAN